MSLDYDPFAEHVRNDPLPWYQRLRDESPVHHMAKYDAWAVSRFQDIWDVCASDALSAARGTTPAQLLTRDQPVTPMLNVMDRPEHTQLRRQIRPCFLPRHVKTLEPTVRTLAHHLLDDLEDRDEFDAIGDFAARLSVTVACMAIGLPVEDGPELTRYVQGFFHHDPDRGGMTPEGIASLQRLVAYCEDKVRERRRHPSDSPQALDAIARFESRGGQFSDADAASHVSMLVIGGSETFPKVLATGLLRLAQHPDQRAELASQPELIPDGFTEILRYDMPTQFLGRTLKRDLPLHGEVMKKGRPVIFLYASANRDEREFDAPDEFDIHRRAPRILSFGAGAHECLGTHVARMEGKICLEAILSRFPNFLVDEGRAVRLRTEFVQGFASLPLQKNLR